MVTVSFHLLLGSLLGATAFKAVPPYSYYDRINHRKGTVIWDHAHEKFDDSAVTAATAEDVVVQCMDAMQQNDVPWLNHGLEICFDFSSDRCRAALGGSLDEFISYASNPTFGSMTNAKSYEIVNVGPIIAGTPTRGSLQTVLVKVTQEKWEDKHFLWTLQQERRPPRQGLWLIHECIYVENAFALTE